MRTRTTWLIGGGLCVASVLGAGDWPQHRGPARHGTTTEPGLQESWGPGEPREVWRRPIGAGYSAVTVAGSRLYTMAEAGGQEWVVCLDVDTGETIWETAVGPTQPSELGDGGPRSTPTVDGAVLYTASSAGTLVALSTADGAVRWRRELDGGAPRFGYSVSPLVDGDLLILESGDSDREPGIVALDKATGEPLWSALAGPAGYSSPIVAEIAGVRQYVFFRRAGNEVASISTRGEPLWSHPTAALAIITTPIFHPPDRIFVASADDAFGGAMLRVRERDGRFEVEELWHERLMRNHFNSSVLVGGHLYGFDNATFRCLDAETGARRWAMRGFGKGSLVAAGDLLFVLGDGGTLALVEATPEAYRELGRATVTTGRAWTAPTLAHGRLYVRDFDEIASFEVGRATPVAATVEEIVRRHLAARGGAERWRRARSLELRGVYAAFSDREPFTLVRGRERLYRLDFTILGAPAVRARDARGTWWQHPLLQPEAARLDDGPYKAQLERESLFEPLLLDHRAKGVRVELMGAAEIDGAPTIALDVELAGGAVERWYLDPESYLEFAVDGVVHDFTQSEEPIRMRAFFDDFRDVGGLKIPFRVDYEFGHRLESMMVEEAYVNRAIDPAIFSPPALRAGEAEIARALELRRRMEELGRELEALLADLGPDQRQEIERRSRQEGRVAETGEPSESPEPAVSEAPAVVPRQPAEPAAAPVPVAPATALPRCGTLEILDSNGDGVISGADRDWRYLSLWKDDGDGVVESSELRSLFGHGIRRVSAGLSSYTTARDTDGGVWVEDAVYFDLPGRRQRAALAIDAGRLARGEELWLEDVAGTRLDGVQVLRAGLVWIASDGGRTAVLCSTRSAL